MNQFLSKKIFTHLKLEGITTRKTREYTTAIESTDSFYTIAIINRVGESHAFNLSRESLRNLFPVVSHQIGFNDEFKIN